MLSRRLAIALAGTSLLFSTALAGDTTNTVLVSAPTATPTNLRALKYAGCFSNSAPMIDHGPYIYQSSGNCQKVCYGFQNSAMALGNGTDCWCGDFLPNAGTKVDDSKCSTKCAGYPGEFCGGADVWSVYQTGYTLNDVPNYSKAPSASSSITTVPTAASSQSSAPSKGGSTAGIAIGVIVGIVLLGALAGGGFFYYRRRQQREMEDYQRQNDVSAFTAAKVANDRPQMWAPDNRLDGAGNRNSNGSIADNADYSRRILQVRNPDDGF